RCRRGRGRRSRPERQLEAGHTPRTGRVKRDEPAVRPSAGGRAADADAVTANGATTEQGLFVRCPSCRERSYRKDLERRLNVCASCGHHFRLTVEQRPLITVDRGSFAEIDAALVATDPLRWIDQRPYPERLAAARAATGHGDALVTGSASIEAIAVAL